MTEKTRRQFLKKAGASMAVPLIGKVSCREEEVNLESEYRETVTLGDDKYRLGVHSVTGDEATFHASHRDRYKKGEDVLALADKEMYVEAVSNRGKADNGQGIAELRFGEEGIEIETGEDKTFMVGDKEYHIRNLATQEDSVDLFVHEASNYEEGEKVISGEDYSLKVSDAISTGSYDDGEGVVELTKKENCTELLEEPV